MPSRIRQTRHNAPVSDRADYSEVFDGNPFEDFAPIEMFEDLQWGNPVTNEWEFDAPEPMVALGELAGLGYEGKPAELFDDDGTAPFLAVGRDSNDLWVIPKAENGGPVDVPEFDADDPDWREVGEVSQTDYYSGKGGEDGYYYHNHEGPYPVVWEHVDGCRYIMPAVTNDGMRSYAVGKAGIVG